MTDDGCPEILRSGDAWSRRSYRCGKPIKRDGLCGVHAAAKDRRAKGDRERVEREQRAKVLADRVEAITGVRPYVRWEYGALKLTCDAEKFVAALDALDAAA